MVMLQFLLRISLNDVTYQPINHLNVEMYDLNSELTFDMSLRNDFTWSGTLTGNSKEKSIVSRENQVPHLQFSKKI